MSPKYDFQSWFRMRAFQLAPPGKPFTLASGKKSSYYIDSKKVLYHPVALDLLSRVLFEETNDIEFNAVGGMETGAIPMTVALLVHLGRFTSANVEGFYVRKEPKAHGTQKLIEGQIHPGDRVVILEDVMTTGGSTIQAIKAVELVEAQVVRVICICDRLEGAAEALKKHAALRGYDVDPHGNPLHRENVDGYDFRPLFTVRDFGIDPEAS